MEKSIPPNGIFCNSCGEAFTLPEDDVDGNLPLVLLCGHIYCTVCLQSMQCDNAIKCPECEVESPIPEGKVSCLQEDSRTIGLIYTNKMNKMKRSGIRRKNMTCTSMDINVNTENMGRPADIEKIEKVVDAALAHASENVAQLEQIHETLQTRLTEHWKSEQAQLESELKQATDRAYSAIQMWKEVQSSQISNQCAQLSSSHPALQCVQEKIKSLQIAIQMAKEVRRVPFLEQYCILDKILETLQAPVDKMPVNKVEFSTLGYGVSCIVQLETQNRSLDLSLTMETRITKPSSESSNHQPGNSNRKTTKTCEDATNEDYIPPSHNRRPQKQEQMCPGANSLPSRPLPKPRLRSKPTHCTNISDVGTPDVIVEEIFEEEKEHVVCPTGPELAGDKCRSHRRRKSQCGNRSNGIQVVVTHIVNPGHFYIHYLTEKSESEALSKRINHLCCGDNQSFTSSDTVETDSMIFAKWKDSLWCRARVVEVVPITCEKAVKACPVSQLASIQVFFVDFGFTETFTIHSEEETSEISLNDVNNHLRKMDTAVNAELSQFAPQAIRCSLKGLVPYDLTKGWSEEARCEFHNVIGSAAVVMRLFGQDRDSLLVDLKKAPKDQSTDAPFSVREYLVLIEVARFYSPVTQGRIPLLYYSPVCPRINTKVDGMVSHINNPSNFYIQLVNDTEYLLLTAKLQDCYNAATLSEDDELSIYCPDIGQACVARCDKLWRRAQITDHREKLQVEVQFVDLGSKKILSVNNLKKLKKEFFLLPAMAIHCCLSDVIPLDGKSWSDASIKRFISLADQKLVTVIATERVPKKNPLPVKLLKGNPKKTQLNIAQQLVTENLACFKEGLKSNKGLPSCDDDFVIWDPPLDHSPATEGIVGDQKEEPLELEPQLKFPAQLKDLKVRVTHVNSPSSFYVLFAHSSPQLKRICEQVKHQCAQMGPQDVVWKADMYCAAVINGGWERGQICSDGLSNDMAEVRRCDHGNTVKLHISELRSLPPSLTGSLAFECTLNNIRPAGGRSTWTDTACDFMSHYLTGASAVMTIQGLTDVRPIPVTLFCSNKMGHLVSIADFLAKEGLALKERKSRDAVVEQPKEIDTQCEEPQTQTDDEERSTHTLFSSLSSISTVVPRKPASRSIMTAEKVITQLYSPPELPCPGLIQVQVSAVGEDGVIYVRTHSAVYQLEQLKQRILQTIKTLPRQKAYTWKTVFGCAVMGSDMLWYRGQLLEVLGGNVKVQYVDYGHVENIPVVHVHPMLLCDDVPQLCIPCELLGINPIGDKWQQDSVGLLREMLLNRSVNMQVMTLPAEPRSPLMVELFLDGLSISKILCHHEHATVDQTVLTQKPPPVASENFLDDWELNTEGLEDQEESVLGSFVEPDLPQTGEHFEVRVRHLCTPNELYLWPLEETDDVEVNGETLDEALSRINTDINDLKQLDSFPCGGPCLAEYSDGMFYRARLIKFVSVEPVMILVQHVDFGSDDTVPPSKLRQMPAQLLQFPSQALKVKVAGFKPPRVNKEEDVLPYSPGWSVKAAREMLDLLHGNITAVIVAREPELTVQLFNGDGKLVHLPLLSRGLAEFE